MKNEWVWNPSSHPLSSLMPCSPQGAPLVRGHCGWGAEGRRGGGERGGGWHLRAGPDWGGGAPRRRGEVRARETALPSHPAPPARNVTGVHQGAELRWPAKAQVAAGVGDPHCLLGAPQHTQSTHIHCAGGETEAVLCLPTSAPHHRSGGEHGPCPGLRPHPHPAARAKTGHPGSDPGSDVSPVCPKTSS